MSPFRFLLTALAFGLGSSGCVHRLIAPDPSLPEEYETCKAVKDPLEPFVVEWPGTSLTQLQSLMRRGVVVVSYAGCNMKVLTRCSVPGGYAYSGVPSPSEERVSISSESDLYARLPLGAASLKGEIASGGKLDFTYVAAGERRVNAPLGPVSGPECEGATHYVSSVMLGAFVIESSGHAKAGAEAGLGAAGVGGERREGNARLRSSGDIATCRGGPSKTEDEAINRQCAAPLQLELVAIAAPGSGAAQPIASQAKPSPAPTPDPARPPTPPAVAGDEGTLIPDSAGRAGSPPLVQPGVASHSPPASQTATAPRVVYYDEPIAPPGTPVPRTRIKIFLPAHATDYRD